MHLRQIGSIRSHLTSEATKSLIHGLVTSRLDYCNALLAGLPKMQIAKLQRAQNTAPRIVTRCSSHEQGHTFQNGRYL